MPDVHHGDRVKIGGTTGTVLRVEGDRVLVSVGSAVVNVAEADLMLEGAASGGALVWRERGEGDDGR